MKQRNLGSCQVELDTKATAKWYAASRGWNCECGHCRNFLKLAAEGALPKRILEILSDLGIPPEKATYVGELFADEAGIHYQFSYRIAGTILEGANSNDSLNGEEGRCCHEPYPYGAPDFPRPHFDMEFYAVLPWALEE